MCGPLITILFFLIPEISSRTFRVKTTCNSAEADCFADIQAALDLASALTTAEDLVIFLETSYGAITRPHIFSRSIKLASGIPGTMLLFMGGGSLVIRDYGSLEIESVGISFAANCSAEPVIDIMDSLALYIKNATLTLEPDFHGFSFLLINTPAIEIANVSVLTFRELRGQSMRPLISVINSEQILISDVNIDSLHTTSTLILEVAFSVNITLKNFALSHCWGVMKSNENRSSLLSISDVQLAQLVNVTVYNNTLVGAFSFMAVSAAQIFIMGMEVQNNVLSLGNSMIYLSDAPDVSEQIVIIENVNAVSNFADVGHVIHFQKKSENKLSLFWRNFIFKRNRANKALFSDGKIYLVAQNVNFLFNNFGKLQGNASTYVAGSLDAGIVIENFLQASLEFFSIDNCQSFVGAAGLVLISNQESGALLALTQCFFTNNFADLMLSPSIFGVSLTIWNILNAVIADCVFANNSLKVSHELKDRDIFGGPGIVFNSIDGNLTLGGCKFVYNRVKLSSAALEFRGVYLFMNFSLFSGNTIFDLNNIDKESSHGAVKASYYKAQIINSTFEFNAAQKGVIYLKNQGSNSLFLGSSLKFQFNMAYTGGCFYLDEKTINRTFNISNSSFFENKGLTYSAIIFVYIIKRVRYHSILFNSCVLKNNTAYAGSIAVIWVYSKSYYSLWNSSIENTKSFYSAINSFGMEDDMEISVQNCFFRNVSAVWAPLFFSTFGILNVSSSRILMVSALTSGGCFYLVGNVRLNSNKTIISNVDSSFGAVIFTYELCAINLRDMLIFNVFSQNNTFYGAKLNSFSLMNVSISNSSTIFSSLFYFTSNPLIILTLSGLKAINIGDSLLIKTDRVLLNIKDSFIQNFSKLLFLIKDSAVSIETTIIKKVDCAGEKIACLFYGINSLMKIKNVSIAEIAAPNVMSLNLFEKGDITFESFDVKEETVVCPQFINVLLAEFTILNINSTVFSSKFIVVDRAPSVTLEKVVFISKGKTLNSSLITFISCPNIVVKASHFSSVRSPYFNGSVFNIIFLIGKQEQLLFESSTFIENSCTQAVGGAIYFEGVAANISQCIFRGNRAMKGGAIYHYCERNTDSYCILELRNSTFESNVAELAGGGFQSLYTSPKVSKDNIFVQNVAPYAKNVATYPWRFAFLLKDRAAGEVIFDSRVNSSSEFYFAKHSSTKQTSLGIILFPIDGAGEKINEKLSMKIEVFLEEKVKSEELVNASFPQFKQALYPVDGLEAIETERRLFGILSALQDSNYEFNFENVSLIGCPGCFYLLKFNSSELQFFPSSKAGQNINISKNEIYDDDSQQYSVMIPLLVRRCEIGEFFLNETNSCESCPEGSYSFEQNQDECIRCPEGAKCDGGSNMALSKGFWRPRKNSTQIYQCNILLENCAGGYDSSCSENYEGILCYKCKQTEETFYQKSFTGKCLPCPPLGAVLAVYVGIILVFSSGILFIINILKNPKYSMMAKVIVKIWVNHLHFLIIIQTYNISLTGFSGEFFSAASSLNNMGSFWFSLECLLLHMFGDENVIYQSLTSSGLLYFEIIAIFLFSYYFSSKWNLKFKLKERIFIIIYIVQPAYVDLIFGNLICEEIDGVASLKSSPGLECWTTTYASWILFFCIPTFIVWLLILPYLFYKHVNEFIETFQDFSFKRGSILAGVRRLSKALKRGTVCEDGSSNSEFLFLGYKNRQKCYLWEFTNYIIKMLIILLNQGVANVPLKLHIILFVLILFFLSESFIAPFSLRAYNTLDYLSKFTLMITCYCLVWTALKIRDGSQYFLFGLMIIVHVGFVLLTLFLSLKWILEKKKLWPAALN